MKPKVSPATARPPKPTKTQKYIPKKGDIVEVDFDPVVGHEQGGRRPAIVLSEGKFNSLTCQVFVCPVTNTDRSRNALEVKLYNVPRVTGVALVDQCRSIHLEERFIKYMTKCPGRILEEIEGKHLAIIGINN